MSKKVKILKPFGKSKIDKAVAFIICGIDKAIDDYYQGKAQTEAVRLIREQYLGELPVGNGLILEMGGNGFPYLILAPTMRIPGNESNSINAYLAMMRGLLVAIARHNRNKERKIETVAIPSLCTGIGAMSVEESAEQMFTAFHNVVLSAWKSVKHPAMAPYSSR